MTRSLQALSLPRIGLIFYFALIPVILSGCSKTTPEVAKNKLKPIDRQEINGVLIIHKNTYRSDNGGLSSPEVLKTLKQQLASDPLTDGLELNLTLSFARLTVAGEAYSSGQVQRLIDLALQMPEIKEVICTVIVVGDSDERDLL